MIAVVLGQLIHTALALITSIITELPPSPTFKKSSDSAFDILAVMWEHISN